MTAPTPLTIMERVEAALGHRFRPETMVAASRERVLFVARDRLLSRRVSLRVNLYPNDRTRAWFLREAESLAQLDHPAIRHVYDAGVTNEIAYRVGNWIEGENLQTAIARGPRPFPLVLVMARDILGGLEHAHARGVVVRRIAPTSLLVTLGGRATVTDLRFCSYTLPAIPPENLEPDGPNFMAPEVRGTRGAPGDPASDVYTAGAILYFALTGQDPPLDPESPVPPSTLRPNCPRAVERILLRALKPSPADRYLSAAEMLEDFASVAGTFEEPAAYPGGTGVASSESAWEDRLRRALGDDYELLSPLGHGGFGRVYRVRDLHLEREVALKVLHPHLTADPAVVERFRREAQLAARLAHANIISIYEIGGRSGFLWYTMELVPGPNLGQLVERDGPLPLDRVVTLLREALGALVYAHQAGLVHRDIKPENMLVDPTGALQITDFGLAIALRGLGRFGGATSRSGTPTFASPEQLIGERVDQRSDLYSVSAVAYFALLGEPPFSGATVEQVLTHQTINRLPPLRARRPEVPESLARVLARGLEAEVDRRYSSAAEFLQAVNEAMAPDRSGGYREWLREVFRSRGA